MICLSALTATNPWKLHGYLWIQLVFTELWKPWKYLGHLWSKLVFTEFHEPMQVARQSVYVHWILKPPESIAQVPIEPICLHGILQTSESSSATYLFIVNLWSLNSNSRQFIPAALLIMLLIYGRPNLSGQYQRWSVLIVYYVTLWWRQICMILFCHFGWKVLYLVALHISASTVRSPVVIYITACL